MKIYKTRDNDLPIAIMRGETFMTGGALRGAANLPNNVRPEDVSLHEHMWGQLDQTYWESVAAADYIVWSYGTPIAWHKEGGRGGEGKSHSGYWVVPEEGYSNTTRRHKGIVRRALLWADVRTPEEEYDDQTNE